MDFRSDSRVGVTKKFLGSCQVEPGSTKVSREWLAEAMPFDDLIRDARPFRRAAGLSSSTLYRG
jgi:hypothetical protein